MNKKTLIPVFLITGVVLLVGATLVFSDFSFDDSEQDKKKEVFESEVVKGESGEDIFKQDFSDFNNIKKYQGKIADIKFGDHDWSKKVSSTVKQVVDRGPTFAGKYAVVTYVCGKECQRSTIVNVDSGKIIADGLRSVYDVDYRLSSRLFIVNPKQNLPTDKNEIKENVSTDYYLLKDGSLKFLGKQNLVQQKNKACAQVVTTAKNKATQQELSFPTPCDVPKYGWDIKK